MTKTFEKSNELFFKLNKDVQKFFSEMKNIDDLVLLLNHINKKIYGTSTHELEKKHLTYHAYISKNDYKRFEIPKKSGKVREIFAPNDGLKYILQTLNIIFQIIHKPSIPSHGFLLNRSVVTNAKLHVNKNYVFNIDLENFFPSIHQARVWKRLQYPPFSLNLELANLIANLVCNKSGELVGKEKNFLPQGSPTSPILSNIICHRLDKKLFILSKEYGLKYTRYADDMTFSSDHNVYQEDSEFLKKLYKIIEEESFQINPKKTRLQKRGYRQEVTGIIVNDKINVSRKYIKNLRALIYLVEKYGDKKSQKIFAKRNNNKNLEETIRGKLQYLKMVKGVEDSTYKTLKHKAFNAYKIIVVKDTDKNNSTKTIVRKIKPNLINESHDPKALVSILRNFTTCDNSPCALKAAVHSEEVYYEFDGYLDYIEKLKLAWKKIDKPLKNLSIRLHAKINSFLFSEKLGTQKDENHNYTWGDNQITFGWSSPELRDWCLDTTKKTKGNNPFDYQLDEKYKKEVNGKTIATFYDICMNVFKHEIEIRSEVNQLYKIFMDFKKSLGSKFSIKIDSQLKGQDFYTDVHWLKGGINTIFSEIKKREQQNKIEIQLKEDNDIFLELHIIQFDSFSDKQVHKLKLEINDGDFKTISERFCSLCDWSIETQCLDGNYRINFLRDKRIDLIETIDYKPKGFTHILRFYK